jgi:hypothetical protein
MGELIRVEFNGIEVAFKGMDQVSLTDLWRAAGSPSNKEPAQWLRTEQAKELINELNNEAVMGENHNDKNIGTSRFVKTIRGGKNGGGGTWACRDLAVSYAGYLSPKLQLFVNRVFLERLKEEANPDLIAERFVATYKRKGFSDRRIKLRFDSIQSNKAHRELLKQHGVDKAGQIMCANNINVGVLRVQKKTYLKKNGFDLTANLRDSVTDAELAAITLSEILSDDKIEKDAVNGNHDCSKVCFQVARSISDAMKSVS